MLFVHLGLKFDYDVVTVKAAKKTMGNVYYELTPSKRLLFKLATSPKTNLFFKWVPKRKLAEMYLSKKLVKLIHKSSDSICFIINEISPVFIQIGLPSFLRRRFPGCFVVFLLQDTVPLFLRCTKMDDFNSFKLLFDCVVTYNIDDSKKYSISYFEPKIPNLSLLFQKSEIKNDVFFVGKCKDRLDLIMDTFRFLTKAGYKCDFYVTDVPKNCVKKEKGITFNKRISYSKAIKKVTQSKAVLNIVQNGVSGITLRDYEAISFNKTLITNNKSIANYSFFNKDKVVFLDSIKDLRPDNLFSDEKYWKSTNGHSDEEWYKRLDCFLTKYR